MLDISVIVLLLFSTIALSGCNKTNESTEDSVKEIKTMVDYTFKDLSFRLPEDYTKSETKLDEINGMKTVSVVVNYNNDSVNGNAEVEYLYTQKGDTVYVICCEIFSQGGEQIETNEFEETFKEVKNSLKLL
ncbi:MAG: hypothetical protein K6D97_05635 [Clostridia bacterium]|nr:hypothetical protein [Clostridia bacterium]